MAEPHLTYRFDGFLLDPGERRLTRDGVPLDLSARYFDALVLLVQADGRLVEKDRFFDAVWGDVVVSDSALTQGIKEVRKLLGDDAAQPRYIQTVPRHGYRFIAPVETVRAANVPDPASPVALRPVVGAPAPVERPVGARGPRAGAPPVWTGRLALRAAARWGVAGALGGAAAGVLGGLLYGSALAYTPGARMGTASILVVLLALNVLVGAVGGAGVSVGMAAAGWARRRPVRWSVAGAALGGLVVGGGAKLLGVDAFHLLFGRAPAGITGGLEGAALGSALALGARLGARLGGLGPDAGWRPVAGAGVAGAVAGALIPALGGHLMGGSLDLVAQSFAGSGLRLEALGQLFGEARFGPTAESVLGGVEGLLFGTCVAGALVGAQRMRRPAPDPRPGT